MEAEKLSTDAAVEFSETANISILNYRFRLKLNKENEVLSNLIRMKGVYSHNDIFLYEKILQPGGSFLDIGANLGWYSLFASKIVGPKGRVFAFEPEQNNFQLLQHNCEANNLANVTALNFGLSDRERIAELYMSKTNFGDYSLGRPMDQTTGIQEVSLKRLDSVLSLEDFQRVQLIKIDVQGAEPQALEGGRALLQKHQPFIIIEFSPHHLYQCGNSPFDLFSFIERYNYLPALIDDDKGPAIGQMLTPVNIQQMMMKNEELKRSGLGADLLLIPSAQQQYVEEW